MATGSLTDCPWLFRKNYQAFGPPSTPSIGPPSLAGYLGSRLPEGGPASSDLPPQDNRGVADSKEPASKSADYKKPAETTTTKAVPT